MPRSENSDYESSLVQGRILSLDDDNNRPAQECPLADGIQPIKVITNHRPYLPFFIVLGYVLAIPGVAAGFPEVLLIGIGFLIASIVAGVLMVRDGLEISPWHLIAPLAGLSLSGLAAYFDQGWGGLPLAVFSGVLGAGLVVLLIVLRFRQLKQEREEEKQKQSDKEDKEAEYGPDEVNEVLSGIMTALALVEKRWKPARKSALLMESRDLNGFRSLFICMPSTLQMLNFIPEDMLHEIIQEIYPYLDAVRKILLQISFCPDDLAHQVLTILEHYFHATLCLMGVIASASKENLAEIEKQVMVAVRENRTVMQAVNQGLEAVILRSASDTMNHLMQDGTIESLQEQLIALAAAAGETNKQEEPAN